MSEEQLIDLDKNKLKEGWQEVRLEKFIDIKHGYAFPGSNITTNPNKNILVTPGNFHIGGGFKGMKFKYFDGDVPSEFVLSENDIVVTMTDLSIEGDTLGYSAKIPKSKNGAKYLHNQRIGLIQFKSSELSVNFCYWLMRTFNYHVYVLGCASGTSIRHTSPTKICSFATPIPPLPEQEAIAEVLSSLGDKIDLLHRQNQTLENLAQILFQQWFVKEASGNWEEKKLGTLVEFIKGRKPQKTESVEFESSLPQILIETFDTGETLFAKQEGMAIANKKDTLMVMDGASSGRVELGFEGIAGSTIGIFKPFDNFNYPFFIHSFLKPKEKYVKENVTGSAIPHADKKMILSLTINFPNISKVAEFDLIATSQFARIFNNRNQIKTLKNIRDTLLPKLMNGKITTTHV